MAEELVIGPGTPQEYHTAPPGYSKGLIERDYSTYPVGYLMCAKPFSIPLITDQKEQQERLTEKIAKKAQLSDIRNIGWTGKPIPSRDQNGKGYCWAHSSTSAALLVRAKMGEPYADLSAYAVACIIKNYKDQGGWGSESLEWIAENGIPTSKTWPQRSMDRANDTPAMRAEAALHKFTEWMDGEPRNVNQMITALLLDIPGVFDFNWWSHSVCGMDLVSLKPLTIRIWNSWGDSWSQNGTGLLTGSHAVPDGMVFPVTSLASVA